MNRYFSAKVASNLPLNRNNNLLTLKPLSKVIPPSPGQFYMIEVTHSYDPLLKRPFSYFITTSEGIHFIYTIRGRGTLLMGGFQQGKTVNLIGPLGNGYPVPETNNIPILVAGGTGIASIYSLAEKLKKKAFMLYGARCRNDLLVLKYLKKLRAESITCTDDGSCGEKGTVKDVLRNFLKRQPSSVERFIIYACGPKPMLESISKIARTNNIKGYFSLEENMACGFGACLGCAVRTIHGYKRVCKEGPVFPIEEIVW